MDAITDALAGGRKARAHLLASYTDPSTKPFPGAVAMVCVESSKFLIWSQPPLPDAPAACQDHAASGRLVTEPPRA